LEASRDKTVLLGVSGFFLEFWSGWRAQKTRALVKFGNFSGNFSEFLGYLEWPGPNHKYFLEIEGPTIIFFQTRRDHNEIYKKLRGLNAKWQGIRDF
jgi:hypothetical protein